jgi:DNA repair protein RadC
MEKELREQPLGRILDRGPGALDDAELLSVLLRTSRSEGQAARGKAEFLLARFGSVSGLGACDLQMARAHNLGDLQIARLLAAIELSRRGKAEKDVLAGGKAAVAAYLTAIFGRSGQQVLGALFVGPNDEALGIAEVFRGGAKEMRVDKKTILREALCRDASGLFVFHIFPETEAQTKWEEASFARQMVEAGESVGIEVIDYLLIGPTSWLSLRAKRPW